MPDARPAGRRLPPKPRPKRRLLALLSVAGMIVVLGGGIAAGVILSKKEAATPKPGPAPTIPGRRKSPRSSPRPTPRSKTSAL